MKRATLALILGLVGFGLFVTSVAIAAPDQPLVATFAQDSLQFADPDTISPTTSISHPVASAMAEYFEVEYSEIAALHEEGLGFGVISHAYFVARTLGISPTEVIAKFQAGTGWGVIMKEYKLPPGLGGRGGNLGTIMSGHDRVLPPGQQKKLSSNEGDTFVPSGQLKKNGSEGEAEFVPPGQLKKSVENGGDGRGGPPSVPPGQAKEKGKKGK